MGKLASELVDAYLQREMPYRAHLDLTWRCPLACRHCFLAGRTSPEMPTAAVLRILDELAGLGTFGLLFSGGEIFSRADLLPILSHARKLGFMIHLKTSGYGVEPDRLEALAGLGVFEVDISFYAPEPRVHDRVTRRAGAFDASLKAALRLQDVGVSVAAVATLLQGFWTDPMTMRSGLLDRGLKVVLFNNFFEALCDRPESATLTPGPRTLARQWRHIMADRPLRFPEPDDGKPICGAGTISLYVSPAGHVWPCLQLPLPAGDAGQESLARIWKESPVFKRFRTLRNRDRVHCRGCAERRYCFYCMGISYHATGEPLHPCAQLCRSARAIRRVASQCRRATQEHA